jgi:hypothetical protein
MSKEYHEQITEIVTLGQDNLEVFRHKWDEFCQWVENCAQEIDDCCSGPKQDKYKQEYQNLRDQRTKIHVRMEPLINKSNEFGRKIGDIKTPVDVVNGLARKREKIDRRFFELDEQSGKLKQKQNNIPTKGWIHWDKSTTWEYLNISMDTDHFFTLAEVINPLVWLRNGDHCGPSGHKDPSEADALKCYYAMLAVIHDSYIENQRRPIDRARQRIYNDKPYAGKYFERNGLCDELWESYKSCDKVNTLQDALERIKADLAKSPNASRLAAVEESQSQEKAKNLSAENPIEVDLNDFNDTPSLGLLTALLADKRRAGVWIVVNEHGSNQPKILRDMLNEHGQLDLRKAIKQVKRGEKRYKLTIPTTSITVIPREKS